jgi:hypothetical protein
MDIKALVANFIRVADLAGVTVTPETLAVEILPAPHRPPILPAGKMGVYIFQWGNQCLKVGKAGPRTHARYRYQHYRPRSSNSNLAKSILKEQENLGIAGIDESNVGEWIKENTDRINILLENAAGVPVLNLLEAFLQCRLKPRFEGFSGQK